jgi:hypothetical protein
MDASNKVKEQLDNPEAYRNPNPVVQGVRERGLEFLNRNREAIEKLKAQFSHDRKALSSLEMEQALDRQKMERLSRSEPPRVATGVERRLAEIEAAVKEIREQIRKPPR